MKIRLVKNGVTKRVKVGFSWTVFFFGGIASLFRGEYLVALALFVADMCTFGVASMIYAFWANKVRGRMLVADGFKPKNKSAMVEIAFNKWGIEQ